ncbi:unnamed protein product [Adineta steineri]|uniref:G-protein coupled receptors family 1 profile domain-containing protein n=1 Tax=Adineta steineri TaxID=433720 RepID=A0A813UZ64_9BILA|nr:unnamed protein product [Adineta steineri]CAF3779131.1 unnamed protein product [Adineta steineri]
MSTLAEQLQNILLNISQYYLIPIFIIGIFGNIFNGIVFSWSTLRNNRCSFYFIMASMAQLFVLIFGCLFRIIVSLTGFDLNVSSLFICKFRTYLFVNGIILSRHFLCLISIDRWMVTSANVSIRNLSTLRMTRLLTIISTIIWLLFNIHLLIGFHIEHNSCTGNSETFYLSFFTFFSLFASLAPLIILMIFTTLTLRNITNGRLMRRRNQKNQLQRLSMIQIIVYILSNIPNTIYSVYASITANYNKTNDQIVTDAFMSLMTSNLLYTYCAVIFFLYTLVSVTFRKECWSICRRFQKKIRTIYRGSEQL